MKIAAVILDLDGTLVDSLRDLAESVNFALGQLSFPTHVVDAYRLKLGYGTDVAISRALPPNRQEMLERAVATQQKFYRQHCCDHSRPYPGINDMLRRLASLGVKSAVLSNKPDPLTRLIISELFPADTFKVVRGHREDASLKPDPASALQIAEELGLAPSRIAFVGDTAVDMETACRAGMSAIGVEWGFRDRSELEQNGSTATIEHPHLLEKVLVGLG